MIPALPINSITLGPLTLHLYGLIIGLALVITYELAQRRAAQSHLTTKLIDQIYLLVIPLGLCGARFYHVISNWDQYQSDPLKIIAIWQGGIGILGGILSGLLVLWLISKRNQLSFLRLTDFFAPLLALGQAIGRWGNYVNQELYGLPTNLPWSLQINPQHRLPGYASYSTFHPLFLYESPLNFINFLILIKISSARNPSFQISNLEFRISPSSFYLIFYGLTRFFLEFLKIDPDTTNSFLGLKTAQYISLGLISAGLYLSTHHQNAAPLN